MLNRGCFRLLRGMVYTDLQEQEGGTKSIQDNTQ